MRSGWRQQTARIRDSHVLTSLRGKSRRDRRIEDTQKKENNICLSGEKLEIFPRRPRGFSAIFTSARPVQLFARRILIRFSFCFFFLRFLYFGFSIISNGRFRIRARRREIFRVSIYNRVCLIGRGSVSRLLNGIFANMEII